MSDTNKTYARILMSTSGGILEIIGLALEFPAILYLLRDSCITACNIIENIPTMLAKNTSTDIRTILNIKDGYHISLFYLCCYFISGIGLSKFGNYIQRESTISYVESFMYGKKK